MRYLKKSGIAITMAAGLMVAGNIGAHEIVLSDNIEEIYYEQDPISFDFLMEEEDMVLESGVETVVTSDYYDMLAGRTLTEEEVLEVLSGLSSGKYAVERALAVSIAGSNKLYGYVLKALSDAEESVRTEAEFYSKRLLISAH